MKRSTAALLRRLRDTVHDWRAFAEGNASVALLTLGPERKAEHTGRAEAWRDAAQQLEEMIAAMTPKERARPTDPATSHAASPSHRRLLDSQAAVMMHFQAHHRPFTQEELAEAPALAERFSASRIRSAVAELATAGLLCDTRTRRRTHSGRAAIVWCRTEAGRAWCYRQEDRADIAEAIERRHRPNCHDPNCPAKGDGPCAPCESRATQP